jgi:acyl transferase domain-containing protein
VLSLGEGMKQNESALEKPGIAIVGLACRFPDAENSDQFWSNLKQGHESLRDFTAEEMLKAGVSANLLADPNYVKRGTVLQGADLFDASFFGFNPREAEVMDPQQRIFLECAWEALESAGYAGEYRPDSIGIYAGSSMNTYVFNNVIANPELMASLGSYQIMLASDKDFLATRASYKLNLRGPGMTVQTACSTALVAINLACQQLLQGQCEMALAGAVSLTFPETTGYLYTEGMILSPDGHCRPFDAQSGGIRNGAGAGILVLKRLEDAVRDRDNIRAVIRGVALNNDGSQKMGYTAPSVDGQAEVIAAAQAMAQINPEQLSYIEAHGTATQVGDPIEVAALTKAFRARTSKKVFCTLGSVKSNIGHLDAAAGVAGVIKTVLALENKQLPATLHFNEPNPQLDLENSPFYVSNQLQDWPDTGAPRLAGVSSFGIGGTNAHAILEEAPRTSVNSFSTRTSHLITLSARSTAALDQSANNLATFLAGNSQVDLADVCHTLHVGRKHFAHRRSVVVSGRENAVAALQKSSPETPGAIERPVAFLFSGQGSQYASMAAGIYKTEAVFREAFDRCSALFQPHLNCSLSEVLYSNPENGKLLEQTWLAQPVLFTVEYALAQMWMEWGVVPQGMMGHSIGEYVAACIAGVFSLNDVVAIVAIRGRLMQQMQPGSMMAVSLSADRVSAFCADGVEIAAVNTPTLVTVSGPEEAIEATQRRLEEKSVRCRKLHTSHAFHSSMMDSMLEPFVEQVRKVTLSAPQIPFVSNLTGRWITSAEATDPTYWSRHLRHAVQFAEGLKELTSADAPVLLEVGPGEVLSTFVKQSGYPASDSFSSLPHPQSPVADTDQVLGTLGRLWTAGIPVDWSRFHASDQLKRVPLPTYPFERQRYRVEAKRKPQNPSSDLGPTNLDRKPLSDWFYVPSWKRTSLPITYLPAVGTSQECWIVFGNTSSLSGEAIRAIGKTGKVADVQAGSEYRRLRAGSYTIRPTHKGDYEQLLEDLIQDNLDPDRVLHLWNVHSAAFEAPAGTSLFSLLLLAQAFAHRADGKQRMLLVVSDETQSVDGKELVVPEKAMVLAPVKVISKELPFLQTRSIDVPSNREEAEEAAIVQNLLLEPALASTNRIVAYRQFNRWEQVYESQRFPAEPDTTLFLRQNGVYLITGGLGGIGLVLARQFAKQVQAKVVLTTRSAFPERSEWANWLASHNEDDPVTKRIHALMEIENAGGEVLVGVADACDEAAMFEVLAQAKQRFGAIHGVVHAAGVPGGDLIELTTLDAVKAVLAPKVDGTRILERLLKNAPPDFMVLCSSIDALLGRVGTADYCAANTFLDSYAVSPHALEGTKVVSINWDAWQEVGMAVNLNVPDYLKAIHQAKLDKAITPEEGVAALFSVLSTRLPQVAVITHDLASLFFLVERNDVDSSKGVLNNKAGSPLKGRSEIASSPAEAAYTDSQLYIIGVWRELLGTENIGLDQSFFELGGHSLLGTGVLSRIRQEYGISFSLRTLFEAPTVRELAEKVDTLVWASTSSADSEDDGDREEIEL